MQVKRIGFICLLYATLVASESLASQKPLLSNENIFERLVCDPIPRLSGHVFDAIPDNDLLQAVVNHFSYKVYAANQAPLAALPETVRNVVLMERLNAEVVVSGFDEYLAVQEAEGDKDLDTTLRAVKAVLKPQCASIYQQALQKYENGRRHRASKFAKVPGLETLDKSWRDNFAEKDLITYVRKNRSKLLDTPQELEVSNWLGEADEYKVASSLRWQVYAVPSTETRSSIIQRQIGQCQKLLAKAETAEAKKEFGDAEAAYRCCIQVLAATEGSKSGQVDSVWRQALEKYGALLRKQGRVLQANAVEWELANHPHPKQFRMFSNRDET